MTTFDERENAFENLYAHDAEMQFKAEARRNKLLGLWAAEKMGLTSDAADAYAKTVVIADLQEVGDEDVYRKVSADLAATIYTRLGIDPQQTLQTADGRPVRISRDGQPFDV